MNKTATIIIELIPMIAYIITLAWSTVSINKKITDRADRKKYKKYFQKELGFFFVPLLAMPFFIFSILSHPAFSSSIEIGSFVAKSFALLAQVFLAVVVSRKVFGDITDLRTKSGEELLEIANESQY
ncbi:MAG TPA: hypothetical protein VKT28_03290 [Puia sp.]|nr:hypothetical protein [Puia sp.]